VVHWSAVDLTCSHACTSWRSLERDFEEVQKHKNI
jgi:hypothetical protein